MPKQKAEKKAVALIAPNGSQVTVSEDVADKFKARGYKAQTRSASRESSGDKSNKSDDK